MRKHFVSMLWNNAFKSAVSVHISHLYRKTEHARSLSCVSWRWCLPVYAFCLVWMENVVHGFYALHSWCTFLTADNRFLVSTLWKSSAFHFLLVFCSPLWNCRGHVGMNSIPTFWKWYSRNSLFSIPLFVSVFFLFFLSPPFLSVFYHLGPFSCLFCQERLEM